MSDLPYIPSELLEPHFTRMIGEWFQMIERMHALDCLATGASAVHASLLISRDLFGAEQYAELMKEKT